MQLIEKYDVYIFDCDGVILNSNQLKIDAMEVALKESFSSDIRIADCVSYFGKNFGRSRFHHVEVFLTDIFALNKSQIEMYRSKILESYSKKCKALYLNSDVTPGFMTFLRGLSGRKYVASGSAQQELRQVFTEKGLSTYFSEVYGSPDLKVDLVRKIIENAGTKNTLMIGDAISDLNAALSNNIGFLGYLPFSTVPKELERECSNHDFKCIDSWSQL